MTLESIYMWGFAAWGGCQLGLDGSLDKSQGCPVVAGGRDSGITKPSASMLSGCFYELGVLRVGVSQQEVRYYFRVYIKSPHLRKLPSSPHAPY